MRQNRDSLVPIHSRGWPNATASLVLPSGNGFLTAGVERTCIEQAAAEASMDGIWHGGPGSA